MHTCYTKPIITYHPAAVAQGMGPECFVCQQPGKYLLRLFATSDVAREGIVGMLARRGLALVTVQDLMETDSYSWLDDLPRITLGSCEHHLAQLATLEKHVQRDGNMICLDSLERAVQRPETFDFT